MINLTVCLALAHANNAQVPPLFALSAQMMKTSYFWKREHACLNAQAINLQT
jgi:hypothetical protein